MIGKTLGQCEIISRLGKGGMGEVHKAKDRKLARDVAIKVLPEEFTHSCSVGCNVWLPFQMLIQLLPMASVFQFHETNLSTCG
jgi:serine/threonine protein kinase